MTRSCAVKAHIRRLPDRPDPFSTPVHRQLIEEVAMMRMEREIEAICEAEAALEEELARDPSFASCGMGIVP